MTTGTPLVVRGAMKPLPTLTKPLRSVDLEPTSPRRPCASAPTRAPCRPPRWWPRRWWRWCWRPPTRRSWAATTSTTPGPRCGVRGADRVEALPGRPAGRTGGTLSSSVHGGRQVHRRPHRGGRAGRPAAGLRPRARGRAGGDHRVVLRPRGRAGVPRARGGRRAAPAGRGGGGAVALGGGSLLSERVRDALASHTVVHLEVAPRRRGGGRRARAGRWPATAGGSTSCTPTADPCTSPSPTPPSRPRAARPCAVRCPR